MLSDIDTPIYMVLGNHDLETNVIDKKPYYIDSVENLEPIGSCYIVENEKRVTSGLNTNITLRLNNSIMFGEKTLILMIDTSYV